MIHDLDIDFDSISILWYDGIIKVKIDRDIFLVSYDIFLRQLSKLSRTIIQLLRRHDRNYNRNGWNADNGFAINSIGVPLLSPMSIPLAITDASPCEYEAMVQPRYRPRVIEDSVSSALSSQSTHWRGDKDIKRNGRP